MKKFICLIVLFILVLTGCATIDTVRQKNRLNLARLSVGMSKKDVLKFMGNYTIPTNAGFIANPFRSETLQAKEKTFDVLYYYTELKSSDYNIRDDELTPLIFEDGKLIGWGWDFLNDIIKKYDIKIRYTDPQMRYGIL